MTTAARPDTTTRATWRNWSGLEEATPVVTETPRSVDEIVDVVRRGREAGTTVKITGTGHSFTGIAAPEHTLLRPEGLAGVVAVDREAMTVTARAGTPLKDLNLALERAGLSLHNMGDIAEQTLAGAVSTGSNAGARPTAIGQPWRRPSIACATRREGERMFRGRTP